MNFVNERKEPLIITQNGESRAVLIDIASYQEMKNAFNREMVSELNRPLPGRYVALKVRYLLR